MENSNFVEGFKKDFKSSTPIEILNWYRSVYYDESKNSERELVTNAIDSLFDELYDLGLLDGLNGVEEEKLLARENK